MWFSSRLGTNFTADNQWSPSYTSEPLLYSKFVLSICVLCIIGTRALIAWDKEANGSGGRLNKDEIDFGTLVFSKGTTSSLVIVALFTVYLPSPACLWNQMRYFKLRAQWDESFTIMRNRRIGLSSEKTIPSPDAANSWAWLDESAEEDSEGEGGGRGRWSKRQRGENEE